MRLNGAPRLVASLLHGLASRLRYRAFARHHLHRALRLARGRGVVFCCWHQHLLLLLCARSSRGLTVLASRSRDGAMMAEVVAGFGIRAIRGSSHRGGAQAAAAAVQALRDGTHLAITVDGPRGPLKVAKPGCVELPRLAGTVLVPVVARATGEWRVRRAWDRCRVPLPGARVALVYGEPVLLPAHEPTAHDIEDRLRGVEAALQACERAAAGHVGRHDVDQAAR